MPDNKFGYFDTRSLRALSVQNWGQEVFLVPGAKVAKEIGNED